MDSTQAIQTNAQLHVPSCADSVDLLRVSSLGCRLRRSCVHDCVAGLATCLTLCAHWAPLASLGLQMSTFNESSARSKQLRCPLYETTHGSDLKSGDCGKGSMQRQSEWLQEEADKAQFDVHSKAGTNILQQKCISCNTWNHGLLNPWLHTDVHVAWLLSIARSLRGLTCDALLPLSITLSPVSVSRFLVV